MKTSVRRLSYTTVLYKVRLATLEACGNETVVLNRKNLFCKKALIVSYPHFICFSWHDVMIASCLMSWYSFLGSSFVTIASLRMTPRMEGSEVISVSQEGLAARIRRDIV